MCIRDRTDARNAVASHDGNAVGGEGPLIGKRTCLSHLYRSLVADALVAEQVLISFFQGLGNFVVLRDNPGWEVAQMCIRDRGILVRPVSYE